MTGHDTERPLRVCYFGTYRAGYTRNQILINGLRANGAVVYECHAPLWRGIDDRVEQASGGWRRPAFWGRVARAYLALLRAHRRVPDYDVMLVGYPGQFDVYLARLLTWRRRRPLALDILMSLHLVAVERGLVARHPFTGRLIYWLERGGLRRPDRLIAENSAYEAYYREAYDLPADRFARVPHGVNDVVYRPPPDARPLATGLDVVYHGTFLASHGVPTIVAAADALRGAPGMHFHFYGDGPERAAAVAQAEAMGLTNVTFHGFVPLETLLDALARAHVVLGVFGATRQSLMTVQNKVYEALAMGRPLISGDAPPVREALRDGEHLRLVPRDDAAALAAAIRELAADPAGRERMAAAGQTYVLAHHGVAGVGRRLLDVLRPLAGRAAAPALGAVPGQ